MLPLRWVPALRAKPGCLLVERLEEPYQWEGVIWIPDGIRMGRRAPFAEVLSVHPSVEGRGVEVGDTVAVSPAAGKRLVFSDGRAQRIVYECRPGWCFFVLRDRDAAPGIEERGEGVRGLPDDDPRLMLAREGRADHGVKK